MDGDMISKEWLWQVFLHTRGASRDSLFGYFRGQTRKADLTPDIMNMVNTAVKRCFAADPISSSNNSLPSTGDAGNWVVDKPVCTTYLYYMVAEHLLQQLFPAQHSDAPPTGPAAGRRFKGLVRQTGPSPACSELVACEEFHMPLVECAAQVVAYIAGEEQQPQYPYAAKQLQRGGCAATLWQAARSFQECFGPGSAFPMPPELQTFLQQLQTQLLDCAVLATGSQLYSVMERGGGCHFREGDASLVNHVLTAYAGQAVQRAQLVGWHAQQQTSLDSDAMQLAASQAASQGQQEQQQQQLLLPESFHEQCAWLMDKVLLHHLDLCFGQHMSVVVACVVYVAAKLNQASLTFKKVTQIIAACVDSTPPEFFKTAEVKPPQPGNAAVAEFGDVRMFYNARFLPTVEGSVRQYLEEYKQHANSTTADTTAAKTIAPAPQTDEVPVTAAASVADAAHAPVAVAAALTRTPLAAINTNTQAAAGVLPSIKSEASLFKPWNPPTKAAQLQGMLPPSVTAKYDTSIGAVYDASSGNSRGTAEAGGDVVMEDAAPAVLAAPAGNTAVAAGGGLRRSTRSAAAGQAEGSPCKRTQDHFGLFGGSSMFKALPGAVVTGKGCTPTRHMR